MDTYYRIHTMRVERSDVDQNSTDDPTSVLREQRRIRYQRRRANMTEEQQNQERERRRIRDRKCKLNRTEDRTMLQREHERNRSRQRRKNMTDEQKARARERRRVHASERRAPPIEEHQHPSHIEHVTEDCVTGDSNKIASPTRELIQSEIDRADGLTSDATVGITKGSVALATGDVGELL